MSFQEQAQKNWQIDTNEMRARWFVENKGRLPYNAREFLTWLLEFTEIQNHAVENMEEIFKEHMMMCVRPIILPWKELGE